MRACGLGLAVLLGAMWPVARAQVAVSAYADKTVVGVGESVLFTVEITGGEPTGALLPPTPSGGIDLVSRSPVMRQRSTFGAQTQVRLGWRYRASRTGVARLAGMSLLIGGRTYTTDPITIDVVQGSPRRAPPGAPPARTPGARTGGTGGMTIRAEPQQREAFVGEQVVVDYVLYFDPDRVSPRQAIAVGTWDAPGFWREELDVPTRETYPRPRTLNGREMQAVTVRRLALFPARAGELELAPMDYEVEVREVDTTRDPFAPFFSPFRSRRVDREVTAAATTISASPLPGSAPPSFNGAVGRFEFAASVSQSTVEPGEPVTLTVTMRGTGNAATLRAPEIPDLDGVDAYAPESERRVDRARSPLTSARTFTYTFVPQGASFEIPEIVWSYFDPAGGQYETRREGPFPITVLGGSAAPVASAPREADWRRSQGLGTAPLWAILGVGLVLPAVAGLGLVAARTGRQRLARRRSGAAREDPLASAASLPDRERARRVERAVREAAAVHLGVAPTLPRAGLAARLRDAGGDADALDQILATTEAVRFAGAALPTGFEAEARAFVSSLTLPASP